MSRLFPRPDACLTSARHPKITLVRHEIADAPDWLRGKTALFASDFHLRPGMDPTPIAAQIAECSADLVLLGGDYADTRAEALRLFDALRGLRAPLGIYAVRGNNDAEAFCGIAALRAALDTVGAHLLVNERASIPCGSGLLALGGVDEHKHSQPDGRGLFHPSDGYRILLSHFPILSDCDPAPDLMLCGHTHGGQFNLFGLTPYAVGFEHGALSPYMVSGVARVNEGTLLVSKGIGASRIPLRVGVRSEIHHILFC